MQYPIIYIIHVKFRKSYKDNRTNACDLPRPNKRKVYLSMMLYSVACIACHIVE